MKVLLLADNFLPSLGGVERHAYTLSLYLRKQSCEVDVLTSPSANKKADARFDNAFERLNGIKISRTLSRQISLPLMGSFQYLTESENVAKNIKLYGDNYDIIHYHGTHQLFLRFIKNKTPIITSVHGIFPACIWQSSVPCIKMSVANCALCDIRQNLFHATILPVMMPYYSIYYSYIKKSLQNLAKVICVSDYVRTYIQRKIPDFQNLVTIHNFVDFEGEIEPELESASGSDIRSCLNLPSNSIIISYFGRLSEDKGVDLLLSAFNILRSEIGDNVYLLIGGAGPQRALLEQKAKSNKNVIFLGILSRSLQISTMAQSNIFVHPARYPDACPTSILEAMAIGLPIVATNLGGIPELVVEGKGGYLVNSGDSVNLAKRILNIVSDENISFRMGTFNRRWSRNFDISYLGPKIVNLYQKIIN